MVPSSVKDARAIRSSAALRWAMLRLLEDKPFDQITVREICAEADVHYATFFRHHASKEALLDSVAAEQIAVLVDLTLPIHETAGHGEGIVALCDYIEQHRALWSTLLNGGAGPTMRDKWLRRARIVSETQPTATDWLPRELGTIASVALIIETVSWWLRHPAGTYSSQAIADILGRLLGFILSEE